jgi:nucleoside-diphosphate-sugar epimerase
VVSRVVVTGGAGMLGGSLVRHLAADGTGVLSVDIRPLPDTGRTGPVAPHAVADIRDASAIGALLRGADAVVHCAGALPSYPASEIWSVIVDGTRSALTASRAAGVARFVHISSTAVYGLPTVVPTPEGHPLSPVDTYGRAKVAAERVCAEYRADGMCVPILRPKTFLGPGRLGLFDMLFEWADDGRNFPVLGAGDARIQMLDIDDLLRAVVTVLRAPAATAGGTFNIGAAEFRSLRDEFQAVLDAAGHGKRVVSLPARPALAVLAGLERMHLSPVYGRLLRKLLADSYVSLVKARDQLGFEPRYSNRDAILRTYHWWRSHRGSRPAKLSGRTSSDPWRQGVLRGVKALF